MSKQIIEINGVKLEVDLSTARRVEEFRVGDCVKVLFPKGTYESQDKIYPGVIIEFCDFKNNPTIVIAYLKMSYSEAKIEYLNYNSQCEAQLISSDFIELPYEKSTVIEYMDREIYKKEQELVDLKNKKAYFINNFDKYFQQLKDVTENN